MAGFAESIGEFNAKAERNMTTMLRKVALGAFSEVIMMSPVDTGRFRGNWQSSVGPSYTLNPNDSVDPGGSAALGRVRSIVNSLNAGDTVWLVNGLPYARRLEYGWSKQAPGGMVRLTVQRWTPIVEAAVKELNR